MPPMCQELRIHLDHLIHWWPFGSPLKYRPCRGCRSQRHAQFYVDFIESENSNGFHAPQEGARILGEAIDYARQGQLALRPMKYPQP